MLRCVPTQLDLSMLDAVLSTASALLDMEVVFLGGLTEETFTFERVHARAEWPGVFEGRQVDRAASMCHWMLDGAPSATCDAAADPAYRDAQVRQELGITSYIGVPVRDSAGTVVATLCGIDRRGVEVGDDARQVLAQLAEVLAVQLGPLVAERIVIRRTPQGGWQVGEEEMDDLTSAMVLADLLADELPGGRPPRPESDLDEIAQLKLSVRQLEHALAARVVVEQAIGVLTERQGGTPRDSFERLRKVARARGRKVHELAREVVMSASDRAVPLPPELAGRR